MIENYFDEDYLKENVNGIAFFIMLFEHFAYMVEDIVRYFYFIDITPIVNGKFFPTVNDEFLVLLEEENSKENASPLLHRRLQKAKKALESYNKDIARKEYSDKLGQTHTDSFRASLEWLHEHGAISETDIRRLVHIRLRRNTLVHEMFRTIGEGLSESDARKLARLFNIYLKVDNWFSVQDLETAGYENVDNAQSMAGATLMAIFRILFLNEGEEFKNALRENGIEI